MGYNTYHDMVEEDQRNAEEALAATRSNEPDAARANLEDAIKHYNSVTGETAAVLVSFDDGVKHDAHNKAMFLTDDEVETVTALRAGTAGVVPHSRLDMSEATDAAPLAGAEVKSLKASEQPRWDEFRQDVELGRAKPTFDETLVTNVGYGDVRPRLYIKPDGFKDTHIVVTGRGDANFLIDLYTWLWRSCGLSNASDTMENLRGFIDLFVEHGSAKSEDDAIEHDRSAE